MHDPFLSLLTHPIMLHVILCYILYNTILYHINITSHHIASYHITSHHHHHIITLRHLHIGIGGRQIVTTATDVLTLGGYLGNVGEGWDREEEYQTRFRLHKSASMMTADAARRLYAGG